MEEDRARSAIEFNERSGQLSDIAGALRANLERGYLDSEERFRQIAEALNDVISLTDEHSETLYFVNVAYERIWGRTREELYANPLAFLEGVHPDDRERVRYAMIDHARESYDLEFRVVNPVAGVRWVWSRGFPVVDALGTIYRIATIAEDITIRKEVNESRARLLRGFTHDVKNPMGAADGYLALLEEGVYGEMSAAQTATVGRARHAIHTAVELIAALMEIERADAGQLNIKHEVVDAAATARGTLAGFRAGARAKQLSVELVVCSENADGSQMVESDGARLTQILANLVSNAIKYTQPGGHITVRVFPASDSDAPSPGSWVAVAVVDNGPGIPLDRQNMLFREFTRFDPGAAEGSGLGLAISQRLAHALGGSISCVSTPGVGSTFTMWLPLLR
ncbi:MAG: PAS domain-containing sensor histidine kinase [Gemmatimonadaceae bacterium]